MHEFDLTRRKIYIETMLAMVNDLINYSHHMSRHEELCTMRLYYKSLIDLLKFEKLDINIDESSMIQAYKIVQKELSP